ncbi:hypothetical protein KSZ_69780 [Dictyobacter formicarum]|uniref:Glucose-methanol-choline oxidoreductase C-terminal domain-containing protein n=1 Tax=Dictyobacter formicarum TaxID=2778368 RepID=A0ABQ3VSW9_9CHLR|nr:hypothetical protein KSZ_69780 [Dictyobacter formicarum]
MFIASQNRNRFTYGESRVIMRHFNVVPRRIMGIYDCTPAISSSQPTNVVSIAAYIIEICPWRAEYLE